MYTTQLIAVDDVPAVTDRLRARGTASVPKLF